MLNGFAAIEQIRQSGASFLVVVWHGFLLNKNQDQTGNTRPKSDCHGGNIKTSVTLHRRAFRLKAYIAGATRIAATLAPGRGWAWSAQAAIVVQALRLVIAGCCALGHTMAAPAMGGVGDGL